MSIVLGDNRYGKAETRLLRVTRGNDLHEIRDLSVTIALAGDFEAVHIRGDNTNVLPTDTQKNTVYAFAKEAPVGEIEEFALRLARHFVNEFPMRVPRSSTVVRRLARKGILGGLVVSRWFRELKDVLTFTCTEVNDPKALDELVAALAS